MKTTLIAVAVLAIGCGGLEPDVEATSEAAAAINAPSGAWSGNLFWEGPPTICPLGDDNTCDCTVEIDFFQKAGGSHANTVWRYPNYSGDTPYPASALRDETPLKLGHQRYFETGEDPETTLGQFIIGPVAPNGSRPIRWQRNVTLDYDLVGSISPVQSL